MTMGRFVVIGEAARVEAFALGGATVLCAEGPEEVRLAWAALPADASVVLLTGVAAAALEEERRRFEPALIAVMPP